MNNDSLWSIFLNASLVNNFVLAYFLGICPFLGVSGKLATATRMGGAVCFVMLVSSVCAYGIHHLLIAIDAPYLQLISYIVVIASTVQLVEMFIKKMSPTLFRALGIFLPLITTNCVILGRADGFAAKNTLGPSLYDGLIMGVGFSFVLVFLGALRELFGNGTLFADMDLLFGPVAANWELVVFENYQPFLLAVLPPGAFIFTGLIIAGKNLIDDRIKKHQDALKKRPVKGAKRVRVTGTVT